MKLKNLPYMIKNNVLDVCMRDVDSYYVSPYMYIRKEYITKSFKAKGQSRFKSISSDINYIDERVILNRINYQIDLSKSAMRFNNYVFTSINETVNLDKKLKDQAVWKIEHNGVMYPYDARYLGWLLYWLQRTDLENICKLYIDGDIHMLFIYDQAKYGSVPIACIMGMKAW